MFKVLIILEEDALALTLREHFTKLGCTVQRLHNLNSIGARLLSLAPKLVISCVKSPSIDGFELAEHLLKRPTKPKLILIKEESDQIDTVRMMKLKIDKLILREGIEKLMADLASGEFMNESEAAHAESSSKVGSRVFVIPAGKNDKYNQILEQSLLSEEIKEPMNSSKIKEFKGVLKKEAEAGEKSKHEMGRVEFVNALFDD